MLKLPIFGILVFLTLKLVSCHRISKRQAFPNIALNVNCDLNTCQNGGKCFGYGNNLSFCICLNGFSGAHCEVAPKTLATTTTTTLATTTTTLTTTTTGKSVVIVAPNFPICSPGVCQNGGRCFVIEGRLGICMCRPGFNGPNCQYHDFTFSRPLLMTTRPTKAVAATTVKKTLLLSCPAHMASLCMNGARCVFSINPSVLTCLCTSSFTGPFCATPINSSLG